MGPDVGPARRIRARSSLDVAAGHDLPRVRIHRRRRVERGSSHGRALVFHARQRGWRLVGASIRRCRGRLRRRLPAHRVGRDGVARARGPIAAQADARARRVRARGPFVHVARRRARAAPEPARRRAPLARRFVDGPHGRGAFTHRGDAFPRAPGGRRSCVCAHDGSAHPSSLTFGRAVLVANGGLAAAGPSKGVGLRRGRGAEWHLSHRGQDRRGRDGGRL